MPLGFDSLSHGRVAFGFFHIETDMLLLEQLFFFAGDLCALWRDLAASPPEADFSQALPGFCLADHERLGDLHGAMAGQELGGFLGALYARWPFPQSHRDFVQKTLGAASRDTVLDLIARFGQARDIPVLARPRPGRFRLGDYVFDRQGLMALVDYLWRGGMPGWQQGRRPEYLLAMARALAGSPAPWFQGLNWECVGESHPWPA